MSSTAASRSEDVKRWMSLERDLKSKSIRYQDERKDREEAVRQDDAKRIADVFALFDYDDRKHLPIADLPMILKSIGCDDRASESTTLVDLPEGVTTFTLAQLLPVALDALSVGRDGQSEESAKGAFARFCSRSHKGSSSDNNSEKLSLDAEGLRLAFDHCGARVSEEEIAELLQYADLDGDGVIGEEDWLEVMRFVSETQ